MHVFIDESGPFTGFHAGSISVVGALAIPDGRLALLKKQYAKIRVSLPLEKGEVKGRLLNEEQIDKVVRLLSRNEAVFEGTVIDLGLHTEAAVLEYKKQHGEQMLAKVPNFREDVRPEVEKASRQILETSVPLYLQAITTFDVLHRLIGHMTAYFCQRRPSELGTFAWVVDGKDPVAVTKWETWWPFYAQGAVATMSKRRPAPLPPFGDYSFFDRFCATDDDGEKGMDLKLLLTNIRFSTNAEEGLELVDIVTNAIRRTLTGKLQKDGWKNIHRVMVHRNEPYLNFILLGDEDVVARGASYEKVVNEGFSSQGKSMLTPSNRRRVADGRSPLNVLSEQTGPRLLRPGQKPGHSCVGT
jgi:hypothetical protein